MNMSLLCAVKPSTHTDTLIHGIQRVWTFSMVSEPVFSLQCSPLYPAGQLHVHVLAAFEYIHADRPAGWLASLFLHFKAFSSSQLPVFINFIQSSCNLGIYLFAKFDWSQTTGLKIISRGGGRKWVGGTWYSWFCSLGNLSEKMVTKYWSQSPDTKLSFLSRTLNGSCKNVHPRQGLVWCVLFWAGIREDRKNSWPSDTAGDKECGKVLCAGNSHGYVKLAVCAQQVRLSLNGWAQSWYYLVW